MSDSDRFIKFIPSQEALWLLKNKGHAFRLLAIVAEAARRYEGDPDGLKKGEAFIGGHKNYDMTEQNYRTAKKILERRQHLKILETSRTLQKSTNGVTTEATKVKLLSSNVWDINLDGGNERPNEWLTNDQRMANDKQESKEREEREDKHIAQTATPLRSKDVLSFDFEKWTFTGISEKDKADWVLMYPHVDVRIEILKAAQWIKSNPSKGNKKNWRKYLTGWFQRGNESAENKKAYQAAKGTNGADRRTQDAQGKPVENQYDGRF